MTIGRGSRRRRRKNGLTKFSRIELTSGCNYLYKIVYDLKPGDIFKFRHRHQAIDCHKAIGPKKKGFSRHDQERWIDFPNGSVIIWIGSHWITEFGIFVPRKIWWDSFPALVDPISVDTPKKVKLRIWKQKPNRS